MQKFYTVPEMSKILEVTPQAIRNRIKIRNIKFVDLNEKAVQLFSEEQFKEISKILPRRG